MSLRVVYIAGSYRAPTRWGVIKNIHRANIVAAEVAQLGAMPLCPHANTGDLDGLMSEEFWLQGTLELMRRCDAVMLISPTDLVMSEGTRGERDEAQRRGLPVFRTLAELEDWLHLGDGIDALAGAR